MNGTFTATGARKAGSHSSCPARDIERQLIGQSITADTLSHPALTASPRLAKASATVTP
jgi:hypothetical protein